MRRNFSAESIRDDGEGRGFVDVGNFLRTGNIRDGSSNQRTDHNVSFPPDLLDRRCSSVVSLPLVSPGRSLEAQVRLLTLEVAALKRSVENLKGVEDRWALRYSRRVATLTNFWVGIILFGSTFLEIIRSKRQVLFQLVATRKRSKVLSNNMALLVSEAAVCALRRSAPFWLASFLLMRSASWKRMTGILVSSAWSLYLALFSKFLPWSNYLNFFANFVYVTCAFNSSSSDVATLKDYTFQQL